MVKSNERLHNLASSIQNLYKIKYLFGDNQETRINTPTPLMMADLWNSGPFRANMTTTDSSISISQSQSPSFTESNMGYANGSSVDDSMGNQTMMMPTGLHLEPDIIIQIGLYSVIFLLAVLGNMLVILTLAQNSTMRTITNLFLLNLSFSDLLVGVLCMPVTLVGLVLRDFVFGAILCRLIPYLQAVAVSVSAWTLVAISVERYYAICHPLTSRRWQTLSHAYKIIAVVWVLSLLCMSPIAILSVLQPTKTAGRHKCRETWPSKELEQVYTVFLDVILLILPLGIMTVKYSLITRTLWASGNCGQTFALPASATGDSTATPSASPSKPLENNSHSNSKSSFKSHFGSFTASFRRNNSTRLSQKSNSVVNHDQATSNALTTTTTKEAGAVTSTSPQQNLHVHYSVGVAQNNGSPQPIGLRRTNMAKSNRSKKRVIQMLFLICAEFFVFWTPLYVINTWAMFDPRHMYLTIGGPGISLIQLLAYFSSCSNPITYGFMNRGFRIAFCHVFGCNCGTNRRQNSNRTDSVRFARNRSVYNSAYNKASEDV